MTGIEEFALRIRDAALHSVQAADRGVRVEDYLTTLAAATGEAALAATGFPVDAHDLPPGSPVFVEAVNGVLTGDPLPPHGVAPPGTVWSVLQAARLPLPDPGELYAQHAAGVGSAGWGFVATSVPEANRPRVMALRAAYELRATVLEVERSAGATPAQRHLVTATALTQAVAQTAQAIAVPVGVRLACEVLVAMAKTAPMTDAAVRAAAGG